MARKTTEADTLNQRRWRFCVEYVYGRFAGSPGRCYAIAYKGGVEAMDATCRANGSRLLTDPEVEKAVRELREELREAQALTPERHMERLHELQMLALASGNYGAAIRAEELRGKAAGFYVERSHHLHEVQTAPQAMAMRIQAAIENATSEAQRAFWSEKLDHLQLRQYLPAQVIDVQAMPCDDAASSPTRAAG